MGQAIVRKSARPGLAPLIIGNMYVDRCDCTMPLKPRVPWLHFEHAQATALGSVRVLAPMVIRLAPLLLQPEKHNQQNAKP
jgi:hypothetical protein